MGGSNVGANRLLDTHVTDNFSVNHSVDVFGKDSRREGLGTEILEEGTASKVCSKDSEEEFEGNRDRLRVRKGCINSSWNKASEVPQEDELKAEEQQGIQEAGGTLSKEEPAAKKLKTEKGTLSRTLPVKVLDDGPFKKRDPVEVAIGDDWREGVVHKVLKNESFSIKFKDPLQDGKIMMTVKLSSLRHIHTWTGWKWVRQVQAGICEYCTLQVNDSEVTTVITNLSDILEKWLLTYNTEGLLAMDVKLASTGEPVVVQLGASSCYLLYLLSTTDSTETLKSAFKNSKNRIASTSNLSSLIQRSRKSRWAHDELFQNIANPISLAQLLSQQKKKKKKKGTWSDEIEVIERIRVPAAIYDWESEMTKPMALQGTYEIHRQYLLAKALLTHA